MLRRYSFAAVPLVVVLAAPLAANAEEGRWTGLYVGVHLGAGFLNAVDPPFVAAKADGIGPTLLQGVFAAKPEASLGDDKGFIGGGQIGYNLRSNGIVFGLEGDFSGTNLERSGSETTDAFFWQS